MDPTRSALAFASFVICAVLLVPAFTGQDSFPISSYPMYASVRDAEAELITARAFDFAGDEIALFMQEIADTDDPLVAVDRMRTARRNGSLAETCAAIAARSPSQVVRVEIITVRYDLVAFASGDHTPLDTSVLERCSTG